MDVKRQHLILTLFILLAGCVPAAPLATITPTLHPATKIPLSTLTPTVTNAPSPTLTPTLIPAGTPFPIPVETISAENVSRLARVARFGKGYLLDLAWSPNGKLIAAGSSTGIQVYDAQTLSVKYCIETNYDVGAVAFSPDSTLLASGGDSVIHLWSAADGTPQGLLPDNDGNNIAIRFSPKGDMLAEVSKYFGGIRLWRLADGVLLQKLKYSGGIDFSPDGNYLAAGDVDQFVILHLPDGNIVHSIKLEGEKFDHRVEKIAYSPNGAILATLEEHGGLNLWNASDGSLVRFLGKISTRHTSFSFSPDGLTIALDMHENEQKDTVGLLRVSDGTVLREFSADPYPSLAFSSNGDKLAIATQGHAIQLWDVANGEPIIGLEDNTGFIGQIAFSPDGKLLAASGNTPVRLWQVSNGALKVFGDSASSSTAFSPDGRLLVSGSRSYYPTNIANITIWRIPDGLSLAKVDETEWLDINCLAFSPDGTMLAEGLGWGHESIQIRQSSNWKLIRTLKQAGNVRSIAFSPDGTLLASGSDDNIIRIWRVSDGKLLYSLQGHKKGFISLAFSPNEPLLASTALDGTVRLWSALTGEHLRTIHTGAVYSLAFSPDGKLLAGGGSFSSVNVWRIEDGKLLKMLKFSNSGNEVRAVAFSPDNKILAAGSEDQTVWLLGIP